MYVFIFVAMRAYKIEWSLCLVRKTFCKMWQLRGRGERCSKLPYVVTLLNWTLIFEKYRQGFQLRTKTYTKRVLQRDRIACSKSVV